MMPANEHKQAVRLHKRSDPHKAFDSHPDSHWRGFFTTGAYEKQLKFLRPGVPPTKAERALYKLILARSDVHAAQTTAMLFTQKVSSLKRDYELYFSLVHAAVIAYARPFTESRANKVGSLGEEWHSFVDARYVELHDELMEFRHTLVAHSDPQSRTVMLTARPNYLSDGGGVIPCFEVEIKSELATRERMHMVANMACMVGGALNQAINIGAPQVFVGKTFSKEPFELTF